MDQVEENILSQTETSAHLGGATGRRPCHVSEGQWGRSRRCKMRPGGWRGGRDRASGSHLSHGGFKTACSEPMEIVEGFKLRGCGIIRFAFLSDQSGHA
jgi:hypothetical protein